MKSVTSARAGSNKVLTSIAQGYENQEFIVPYLSPAVTVTERGGLYIVFDKSQFRLFADDRAPGSQYNVIEAGYTGKPYKLRSKGLIYPIPIERKEEEESALSLDTGKMATETLTEAEMLNLEVEGADLFTTAANYNSNNTEVLSGSSQWSDPTSTPAADIRGWSAAVSAAIGKKPNVMAMGFDVFQSLCEHPSILDRIKHTSRDSVTPEILANLYGFDKVVVGEALVDRGTGVTERVWGKNVILARVNPAGLKAGKIPFSSMNLANRKTPSFAYTYVQKDSPVVSNPWYDDRDDCYRYKIRFDRDTGIVGVDDAGLANAGFLARSVVA
jgi:Phage major capsid protein E